MNESELMMAYRNAGMDGSKLVRDPAEGVAIAKCLLHRILRGNKLGGMQHYHPQPCRFCPVDRENLQVIYGEWMNWSMLERDGVELPGPVETFMQLPAETQAALVRRAQGYEEENAPADRLPKGADDPYKDPARGNKDESKASSSSGEHIDPEPSPPRVPGWAIGGVRAPRQQRRRS